MCSGLRSRTDDVRRTCSRREAAVRTLLKAVKELSSSNCSGSRSVSRYLKAVETPATAILGAMTTADVLTLGRAAN